MPRKTNSDKIDDIDKLVPVLNERIDNVRDQMKALKDRSEEDVKELKGRLDAVGNRFWGLVVALLVAGAAAFLNHYLRQ